MVAPKFNGVERNGKALIGPDIRARLKPLYALDNINGTLSVLGSWLAISVMALINNKLFQYNPYLGVLLYPLSAAFIGGRIRGFGSLVHQSVHRCLAASKPWNDILGSVMCAWPVLQGWTEYYHNHIHRHHPYLGHPEKDPDYVLILQTGLYSENTTRGDVINYLKSIPSPRKTLDYLVYVAKDRLLPGKAEARLETVGRLFFCVTVVSAFYHTNSLHNVLLYWIIPMLTTTNWIGNFCELLEHFPLLDKNRNWDELQIARNRLGWGWVADIVFNAHGDNYHLVHHLFPRMPHWNLKKAHEILMDDDNYRQANDGKVGISASVNDMLQYFPD